MVINSKIAYVKHKATFESLIPTIPQGLNPIVFIEDTREMWTCGTYFSIGYPGIEVTESSGSVNIAIGNSSFFISTSGESLSVRKGDGNRVIIGSNALTKVNTEAPLKWEEATKKLLHMESGATPGSYGPSSSTGNASVIPVSNIVIDDCGHIVSISDKNIEIRDYVEQLPPTDLAVERNLLTSYNEANNYSDTAPVRKARGITVNDATQRLTVPGGIEAGGPINVNEGDLTVKNGYIVGKLKGDVEGSAVPKIHLSTRPEYGGASKSLYGHVTLQDNVPIEAPPASSSNNDVNNIGVVAVAASPLMVWNAVEDVKKYVNEHGIKVYGQDKDNNKINLSSEFTFSNDFVVEGKNVFLRWEELWVNYR